jgi:hypothetical protein
MYCTPWRTKERTLYCFFFSFWPLDCCITSFRPDWLTKLTFGRRLTLIGAENQENLRFLRASASQFLCAKPSVKFVNQPGFRLLIGRRYGTRRGCCDRGDESSCADCVVAMAAREFTWRSCDGEDVYCSCGQV